jgi:P pilus assembly chaperone PapD
MGGDVFMGRIIAFLLAFLAFGALYTPGQTISPVIVEYQQKAKGRFQVTSDSDVPLTVVLEPESFRVDEKGNPTFYPLDPNIHLELSTTSFRLAPHQTYMVFYKASASHLPAWFTIYATVTGKRTNQGIELAIHLPHTVYLMTKKPLASSSVVWDKAEFSPTSGKVEGLVTNQGSAYARVVGVFVTDASGKKHDFSGFPFFPGQQRQIELPWKGSTPPKRIELKFAHFTSGEAIQDASASAISQ